ncbi:hypothetical protein ACFRCX_31165 [Streptomyces sp. NPDC056652]|uniref:hypothetical protein n=1 Tax=Streptomyces sp. NPDC056652 TaxID=3345893 RepID=UPI0036997C13
MRNAAGAAQNRHGLLDLDGYLGGPDTGTLVHCYYPEPLLLADVEERRRPSPLGALREWKASRPSGRKGRRWTPGTFVLPRFGRTQCPW